MQSLVRPCTACTGSLRQQAFRFERSRRFHSTSRGPNAPSRTTYLKYGTATAALGLLFASTGWLSSSKHEQQPLSYAYFTPLTIRSLQKVTADTSMVELEVPARLLPRLQEYPEPPDSPLQAIYIRQPELQIQRAYTPLSSVSFARGGPSSEGDDRSLRLLVKRYNDGEVSTYLHRLQPGDSVFVRGPVRTWTLPQADELIFVSPAKSGLTGTSAKKQYSCITYIDSQIAGGTGITPLAQLLEQRDSLPDKVKVVYACSSPDLSLLKHIPGAEKGIKVQEVHGRLRAQDIQKYVGRPKPGTTQQIIICGPEGYVVCAAPPSRFPDFPSADQHPTKQIRCRHCRS